MNATGLISSLFSNIGLKTFNPVSAVQYSEAVSSTSSENQDTTSTTAASSSQSDELPIAANKRYGLSERSMLVAAQANAMGVEIEQLPEDMSRALLAQQQAAAVTTETGSGTAEAEVADASETAASSDPVSGIDGTETGDTDTKNMGNPTGKDGEPLSDQETKTVNDLKQRDTEVRQHEQAHVAAGAGLTQGGPSFSYTTGPDGNRYATGGEVSIDTSEANTPEQTVRKMQTIRAAALAPANPSTQDRRVAAAAAQKSTEAMQEIQQARTEDAQSSQVQTDEADSSTENADTGTSSSANRLSIQRAALSAYAQPASRTENTTEEPIAIEESANKTGSEQAA